MKEEITKTSENPSMESINNGNLKIEDKQIENGSENNIVGINDEASSKMEKALDLDDFLWQNMMNAISVSPLTELCDINSDSCFNMADFENLRRKVINKLDEFCIEGSAYLEDYRCLIVTCDCGGVIGEVENVRPDQIDEIVFIVNRCYSANGPVYGNCDALIEYYKNCYEN